MPSNFKSLLNNRDKAMENVQEEASKTDKRSGADDRFWKPTVDEAGNGMAIIRFLPSPPGDDENTPFVRYWEYGFKGPGGWYIEKSRKTLGREMDDPVFTYKGELWETGTKENQDLAKTMKTNMNFVSNIYVVKDPKKPENEGKVFLYRYGNSIFEQIKDQLKSEFGDDPVNVFDFFEGANFKLRAYNKESNGFRSYDKSSFESPSALFEDEEMLENIWNQQHPLQEFIAPESIKSFEDLQDRLHKVMKLGKYSKSSGPTHGDEGDDDDGIPDFSTSGPRRTESVSKTPETAPPAESEAPAASAKGDDDDDMSFFQNLAN